MILNFDQTNKTRFPSVFIMITAWQAHANLSMISESTNNCEEQVFDKLISTLKNDFRLITEGLNDEGKKPLIDHIAVLENIKGEFSKIIPEN